MFREEKNLKDTQRDSIKDTSSLPAPYEAIDLTVGSYTKTDKLVTALYMVTDIIHQDEPLRNKLRTLGVEILSDIITPARANLTRKIQEVMSFLDLASAMNIISEMNSNILRKEFAELYQSVLSAQVGNESITLTGPLNKKINLTEFFAEADLSVLEQSFSIGHNNKSIGHHVSNSLGVQRGSTLLKALSNKKFPDVGHLGIPRRRTPGDSGVAENGFDILKKQRRDEIVKAIQKNGGNATITDIKKVASGLPAQAGSLVSCGEKTLQRELVSMVVTGVLYKTGEKRWSRYFVK